jgi:hypothetical protein
VEPFDGVLDVEPKGHKQEPLKREEKEDDTIFLETNTHTQKGFLSVETLKDRHHLFISIIRRLRGRLQRFYSRPIQRINMKSKFATGLSFF